MACGCGGGQAGDQWVHVDPTGNVSKATTKAEAQEQARQRGGYIRAA